jgi:hypothetical protein
VNVERHFGEPGEDVRLKIAGLASKDKRDDFEDSCLSTEVVGCDHRNPHVELETLVEIAWLNVSGFVAAETQPV